MSRKQEIIVFDIGSSKIAAAIGSFDSEGNITVQNKFDVQSDGIRSSLVTDLSQAEESVINLVLLMEKSSKALFKEASISVCASNVRSSYVSARVRISGGHVTNQDMQKLVYKALDDFNISGQEVIHYFPIDFTLDNSIGIANPVGLIGQDLSCNLHILSVDGGILTNLMNCLGRCQIKVQKIILSVYAAGLANFSIEDRKNGAMIVDFGAKATSFGILQDEKLMYCGSVPIGSWYITSDIAKAFSISIDSAEKLKILYGSSKILENANLIHLKDIDSSEFTENQVISTRDLSSIINARVEEIFTLLKAEYNKLKVDDLITNNLILTGGGSSLNNIAETVGDIFAKVIKTGDTASDNQENKYDVAVGMLKYLSKTHQDKLQLGGNIQNQSGIGKLWSWFKDNI